MEVKVRLEVDNIKLYQQKIRVGAAKAVRSASRYYQKKLFDLLNSQPVGSVPVVGSVFRRRARHSRPGQPPYIQTWNYVSSLLRSESIRKNTFTGRVSTRVPYARQLERGIGAVSIDSRRKRYTNQVLVPTRLPALPSEPRPAWIPVFSREWSTMLKLLKNEMKKELNR